MAVVVKDEKRSVLDETRSPLLSCLNTETDSSGAMEVSLQCSKYRNTPDEVDKLLDGVSQLWSNTEEEDCSTVAGKELNKRIELSMTDRLEMEPFSFICGVVYVTSISNRIPPLSRPVPCTYRKTYIYWFYRYSLAKEEKYTKPSVERGGKLAEEKFSFVRRHAAVFPTLGRHPSYSCVLMQMDMNVFYVIVAL